MKRSVALLPLLLAACVPASRQPAPVPPQPRVVAAPAPRPAPALGPDWRDWPLTPGTWTYAREAGGSVARFSGSSPLLSLVCRQGPTIALALAEAAPGPVTIRTSSTTRRLALGAPGTATASSALAASDPLLDAMAFSRGRFVVEAAGRPPLVIPAYPEVARVVEDCRP